MIRRQSDRLGGPLLDGSQRLLLEQPGPWRILFRKGALAFFKRVQAMGDRAPFISEIVVDSVNMVVRSTVSFSALTARYFR